MAGVEPARLSTYDPKSYASASSATSACMVGRVGLEPTKIAMSGDLQSPAVAAWLPTQVTESGLAYGSNPQPITSISTGL